MQIKRQIKDTKSVEDNKNRASNDIGLRTVNTRKDDK